MDVVLVDDIPRFSGKPEIEDELFHIFNYICSRLEPRLSLPVAHAKTSLLCALSGAQVLDHAMLTQRRGFLDNNLNNSSIFATHFFANFRLTVFGERGKIKNQGYIIIAAELCRKPI